MLAVMALAFVAIGGKLALIQGVDAHHYLTVGQSEWTHTIALAGDRGAILDSNGDELAMSTPQSTIYADPHQVSDPRAEATQLAPILGISQATLQGQMSADAGFVYLAHTQPDAVAEAVTRANLAGVYTMQEPKRFHPSGQLALPLLGAVGTDGTGLSGLEAQYNKVLSGAPGRLVSNLDPEGRQIAGGVQEYQAPTPGRDVVLTIDAPLQYEAEQTLAQAIVSAHGHSGVALMMDSQTGRLLAVADLTMPDKSVPVTMTQPPAVPVSIPSTPVQGTPAPGATTPPLGPQPVESPSASAFTEVYEPGSVNKLITMSAALQTRTVVPADHFTIPNQYRVAGSLFGDAEQHPPEYWSVTDILANSSNIGTIQIAQKLGRAKLMRYLGDFGIGHRTDINFPGESQGLLPSKWSGTSIATVPIGQGISVTAIQMLAAYNAIANGGVYIPPRLVEGTIDAKGHLHASPAPPSRRVVSTKVADQMRTMLEQVVTNGTGTAAAVRPYTVAGKTGTAEVPLRGGYEGGHYVASFVGYVPAEKPSVTAMVQVYDTPDFGAAASAPAFATISRDALGELKVPPRAPLPPAPGVPLATTSSANPYGELPSTLPEPVAPTPATTTPAPPTPATTTPATTTPAPPTPATTTPVTPPPATTTPVTPTAVTRPTPVTPTPVPPTPATTGPTTATTAPPVGTRSPAAGSSPPAPSRH